MIDTLIRLIADGLVIVIALAGASGYFIGIRSHRNQWQLHLRTFMAGLSALTVAKILSLVYVTAERPFITLGVLPKAAFLDNPGFPSDHALFVAVITLVLAFNVRNRRLVIILAVLSLLVGTGRVMALVHTPVDVLGGFLAAICGVAPWYIGRSQRYKRK